MRDDDILSSTIFQQQDTIRELITSLSDRQFLSADERFRKLIRWFLLNCPSLSGGSTPPATLLDRDIAQSIGVSASEVSRIKKRLIAEGSLARSGRSLVILRPDLFF